MIEVHWLYWPIIFGHILQRGWVNDRGLLALEPISRDGGGVLNDLRFFTPDGLRSGRELCVFLNNLPTSIVTSL